MRIAYISHDSFPSSSTNTQQIFWTICEVARLNVSIELIVPSVTSAAHVPRQSIAAYYGVAPETVPASLAISACGDRPLRGWASKGWFGWDVARRLTGGSYDLIWTRDPFTAMCCVNRGLSTVFETYRPDLAASGRFGPWRRLCLGRPGLRCVVVHSRVAADAYMAAGVPPERCLLAHNGFAPSLQEPVLSRAEARARLGLAVEGRLVVYAGHVGREKGIDALIRMAAAVPEARFMLLGVDGLEETHRLEEMIRRAGAGNVVLRPRVTVSEVATYLYAADCLIIPPTDEPLRRFRRTVLPMKIFAYLAAGRPILAPRLPDIEEVLADNQTARLVSPHDLTEATAALVGLLSDSALQDRLARNALSAAQQYTWEARAKRIVSFLDHTRRAAETACGDTRSASYTQPANS